MRHTPLFSKRAISQWLVALAVIFVHTPAGFAEILRKEGPPPVFTGSGGPAGGSSSGGGGGGSSSGRPVVRYETVEQQKSVFPTVQLGKGEGAILAEMDKSRKKADLTQLLNMSTDLPGMIKEEQTKGLKSFEIEKTAVDSSERANRHVPALSGPHVQVPDGFEVEPIVGITDSGSPVPRRGYRDMSSGVLSDFQATNRTIKAMTFSELMVSISKDPEVAAAVGVDAIIGGVVSPFLNFTAKVGDEMVRTVQCATQGLGLSTGCSTPTEFQDYWGSLMTGEGQSYTAGALALDALIIGAGPTIAGMGADAAVAVLKKVPEGLEAVAKGVGRGAERLRTGYAATGFADETGAILVREGERVSGALASEVVAANRIIDVQKVIGPSKFQEIRGTLNGSRPSPESYLSKEYIDQHINDLESGVSRFMPETQYNKYGPGQIDGTAFVIPKSQADELINKAKGDPRALENALGLPQGQYENKKIIRIDFPNPKQLGVRIPSGNEAGATDLWLPGGRTPQGYIEGIVDVKGAPPGSWTTKTVLENK